MPIEPIDIWEIYILADVDEKSVVFINKNESVANLFKKFRARRKFVLREKRLTFLISEGTELKENDRRRLVDVSCLRDKCNIRLIVHEDDCGLQTIIEKELLPLPGFIETTTTEPDMLGLDDEGTVLAKMPCGHVIGPTSMTSHCQNALSEGKFKFYCPSVDHAGKANCNREWDYFLVRHVACLSSDEMNVFEKKISNNYLQKSKGSQTCPGCGAWCYKENVNGNYVRCPLCDKNFCWACMRDWIGPSDGQLCGNSDCDGRDSRTRILVECPTKEIGRCQACPMTRACPKCGMLTEHKDKCAHVTCPTCGHGFCFICLKGKKNNDFICTYEGTCTLAPRQTSQPAENRCSIL